MKISIMSLGFLVFGVNLFAGEAKPVSPNPLPKVLRIESATPRQRVWERLTDQQKLFAYHLMEAGKEGKKLLTHQLHRHGNLIRQMIETSVLQQNLPVTKKLLGEEALNEYLIYGAKFLDQSGPYASSNRKYLLTKVTPEQVAKLLTLFAPKQTEKAKKEVVALLTDPKFEVRAYPENQEGLGLEETGGNLYERGITGREVKDVLDKSLKVSLNCRVVKRAQQLGCELQSIDTKGIVGQTLKRVVKHLEAAKKYALTELQKQQIEKTLIYFKKGDVEDFRQANIAWVKDGASSAVDFMIGWVEVYEDWLARIGSWETYVQIVDPEVSKIAQSLASHAQYFEDSMPYGSFKKKFKADYAPPAIMVYYFQERGSYRTGGYNLPNFDDIRRDVGAKNVIRLPLPGETEDPDFQAMYREMLTEYMPAFKIDVALKERERIWRVLVLLHEIIGHGSGTYDVNKFGANEDPISALGPLGSALEEQRADLTALVFGGDQKLVDVGIYKNLEEAKQSLHIMYDYYIADFLRRTSGQRTFTEAHQRGHWLFIQKLLEKKAIAWVNKSGEAPHTVENGVLAVKNYDKFHEVAVSLLGELQRIKANRDEAALKELFAKYASLEAINEDWAQAIIRRGQDLKINAGYVEQPWKVTSKGQFQIFGGKTLESIAPYWKIGF